MANNIKAIIEMFGLQKKEVAEAMEISTQALNSLFKSEEPKKWVDKLSTYLKVNPEYFTKDLDEKDKRSLILQHYGINSSDEYRKKITVFKYDTGIELDELSDILDEWKYEDIDEIVVNIETKDMYIPQAKFKDAGITILDGELIIYSHVNELYSFQFKTHLIERIIKRWYSPTWKRFIIELKNSITVTIAKFHEENENLEG